MGIIDQKTTNQSTQLLNGLVLTSIFLFLAIQIRRAWLSDDAFITFRTVDNFLKGYGLVWNIGERVQTYTHPLWMLVLSFTGWLTHELVFTSMILSILLSLAATLLLLTKIAVSRLTAFFIVAVLLLSNAFVDYSTSGLENPLSHLLLVLFFTIYFTQKTSSQKIFWLSLVASFGALNRLDLMLIFAPLLIYELLQQWQITGILYLVAGQFPLILWELFSVIYYGFPFPNTAYAKLNTGIPALASAYQGALYFIDSLRADPITLVMIGSSILIAALSKSKKNIPIAIGILLYLVYVMKIGGDFMSGRFLAAPFLCSLVIFARYDLSTLPRLQVRLLFCIAIVLGFLSPTPTLNFWEADLTAQQRSTMVNDNKISNERRYYSWSTGLLRIDPQAKIPKHPYAQAGIEARSENSKVVRRITVGMFGYYAGPQVFVVDELALGDALLARLPARRVDQLRIGHFQRTIPDGYLDTLRTGQNLLADSSLGKFYDQLLLLIRAPVLDPRRLAAIWNMNTGKFANLIDFDTYRYPKMVKVALKQVDRPPNLNTSWDAPGNIPFDESGIEIDLGDLQYSNEIGLSLDANNAYRVEYRRDGQTIAQQEIKERLSQPGLQMTCLKTPKPATDTGFTALRIFAIQGDKNYSLGNLVLNSCPEK
jgi:arabinofuranosyltransferase